MPKKQKKTKEVVSEIPKKKKVNKKIYFGMDVQDAIVRYNSTKNTSKKNKIYQEEIHYAFDKLSENIINTFKFSYFDDPFEDVKNEVVSFLVLNIHKFDHTKGSKAFSYFSVVAKNYLILHNNANYKRYCSHSDLSILDNRPYNIDREKYLSDFTEEVISYIERNIKNLFRTKRDIDVAYAIIELMKKRHEIENFNKKALYILIREMTNIDTSYITKVVNVFKKEYKELISKFEKNGIIEDKKIKFFD